MADNGVLFKLVAKSMGMKHGVMPTFMAKPWGDVSLPFAYNGASAKSKCSCQDVQGMLRPTESTLGVNYSRHIHVSLQDETGRNIFAVSDEELKAGGRKNAAYEDVRFLSQEGEWFLGGLLEGLSDGKHPFLISSNLKCATCSGPNDVSYHQLIQAIAGRRRTF